MDTFRDRVEAGQQLAGALSDYANRSDVIVLGLPRGGVPVAYEVANALKVDLDVLIVRKLGYPGREELAVGAIASGGIRVLNEEMRINPEILEEITQEQLRELHRRETAYRGEREYPKLEGRCVLLVDDGLATGATMRAAVTAVQQQAPQKIVVAIPVAPSETIHRLQQAADEVVCLLIPDLFFGVGQFYVNFTQTSDEDVRELLQRAWRQNNQTSQRVNDPKGHT